MTTTTEEDVQTTNLSTIRCPKDIVSAVGKVARTGHKVDRERLLALRAELDKAIQTSPIVDNPFTERMNALHAAARKRLSDAAPTVNALKERELAVYAEYTSLLSQVLDGATVDVDRLNNLRLLLGKSIERVDKDVALLACCYKYREYQRLLPEADAEYRSAIERVSKLKAEWNRKSAKVKSMPERDMLQAQYQQKIEAENARAGNAKELLSPWTVAPGSTELWTHLRIKKAVD